MSNEVLEIILGVIGGGGAGAGLFGAWGKVRVKKLDVAFEERKQFVKELNDLRSLVNELSKQQFQLMQENSTLKITVDELKSHINHKSEIINQLKEFVKAYNASPHTDAADRLITQVIELVD